MKQKCSAPARAQKQPKIFYLTLEMRTRGALANFVGERHGRLADEAQDRVGA